MTSEKLTQNGQRLYSVYCPLVTEPSGITQPTGNSFAETNAADRMGGSVDSAVSDISV